MSVTSQAPERPASVVGTTVDHISEPGRWKRLAFELLLAVGAACVVSLGLQWVVTELDVPEPTFVPLALLALSSAVLLGVAVWLMSKRSWPRWASPLSWSGLAALGTLPLALSLQNTPFYLHGISQDQYFRIQYLQRLTESLTLSDGNYWGMPPFYPAGWFWVGARFANLFDMPAWAAYKPYAILTMAVAPVIAFVLWSRITRRPVALLLSVLTAIVGVRIVVYEPYSWLIAASLVPVGIIAWREFRRDSDQQRRWGPMTLIGLFVGLCGAIYTLYFGFASYVLLVLALVAAGIQSWHARRTFRGPLLRTIWHPARRAFGDLLAIGVIALPVMLLVWTPYLLRVVELGTIPPTSAARFLPSFSAVFPTPMFEMSLPGAMCLAGTFWIVLAWRSSQVARALGILALCCYGWYVLSFLALSAHTTLLAFRVGPVLQLTLFAAAALGGIELMRALIGHFRAYSGSIRAVFVIAALLGTLNLVQTLQSANGHSELYDTAYETYLPAGHTPLGEVDTAENGAWNDELLTALEGMATGKPQDHVLLTAQDNILVYRPYWGFQMTVPYYANPLADFAKRNSLIESWAHSSSPHELTNKLKKSPYRPPDVFVFRRADDGLHIPLTGDAFPEEPSMYSYDVVFSRDLFSQRYFKVRDVGPFTVVVRR